MKRAVEILNIHTAEESFWNYTFPFPHSQSAFTFVVRNDVSYDVSIRYSQIVSRENI